MIKNFAMHVQAKTSLVIGTDLFVGFRPQDAPDNCVVLLESIPDVRDFDLPDKKEKSIQVLGRNNDYHLAQAAVKEVCDAILGFDNAGFDLNILPTEETATVNVAVGTGPGYVGQDDRNRHEFSANFILRTQDI